MCDDVAATVAELEARGTEFVGEVEDYGLAPSRASCEPSGVDVVEKATDVHAVGDQRVRADPCHIVVKRRFLVGDDAECRP